MPTRKTLLIVAAMSIFVASAAEKTKVACIGDSITYGLGLANRDKTAFADLAAKAVPK